MTKCLNSKKVLRSNCISSNSDASSANISANNNSNNSKMAIRNRLKMEKKLERLSTLTKKLLDDLDDQEDINNNHSLGNNSNNSSFLYVHGYRQQRHQHQDTDDENEATKFNNNSSIQRTKREQILTNTDYACSKECVVCLANPARIETMPCRHAVLCKRCFLRTIQTVIGQGTATLKCVLCRAKIVAINELELNSIRSGDNQPSRSTDPIKPKFKKSEEGSMAAPCRSAVTLFRRSSKVQDVHGGAAASPPGQAGCQRVVGKNKQAYALLTSHSYTFDDRQTT